MLCLTRKKDQRIIIGEGLITIQVLEIQGDKVRLGFTAPKDITIHREEVHLAIEAGKNKGEQDANQ